MRGAILLASTLLIAGCARNTELRAEIAALQGEVKVLESAIVETTPDAGAQTQGMHTRVAYRPVLAWADRFNARPAAERTIRFRQTARHGRLKKDDWDCGWFGDGGWYVELNSGTATRGDVLIQRFELVPGQNQLTARVPLAIDLETRIHWHFDPCVGGGFGGNIFVDIPTERVNAVARVSFKPVKDGKLPYSIDLTSPNNISVTARFHIGAIGTLGVPFRIDNIARHLSDGEIGLVFENNGEFGPLPNGQVVRYKLVTSNPSFQTDQVGLRFGTDIATTIDP